jgi:AraC-like DNA-binding protein
MRAYHVVVNAMEGRPGWTPLSRFAATVTHVLDGHLPYSRYHAAGRARQNEGAGEGVIERMVREWLATDLNPVVQVVRSLNQTTNVIQGYNAYNASAQLGVKTRVSTLRRRNADDSLVVVKRDLLSTKVDPEPCRVGTIVVFDYLLGIVQRNEKEQLSPKPFSLVDIANYLGVAGSAAGDVALVFQSEGGISVPELAKELGCHQRTLARRLRQEGLTAELLRLASRLIRATTLLKSDDSLTTIAADVGFADQAHMTRAFRASCGMTPSMLRALYRTTRNEPAALY